MVVIDTSVIIDHIRQNEENSVFDKLSKKSKDKLAISLITVQELFEGNSTRHEEATSRLLSLINALEILPYTFEVARLAGEIARDLDDPIDLADAAIAATVILNEAELLTLNIKDFKKINGIKLLK